MLARGAKFTGGGPSIVDDVCNLEMVGAVNLEHGPGERWEVAIWGSGLRSGRYSGKVVP